MRQKPIDILLGEAPRMAVLVKLDVPANPVDVGLFRASAIIADPQNLNDAVVKTRRGLVR